MKKYTIVRTCTTGLDFIRVSWWDNFDREWRLDGQNGIIRHEDKSVLEGIVRSIKKEPNYEISIEEWKGFFADQHQRTKK